MATAPDSPFLPVTHSVRRLVEVRDGSPVVVTIRRVIVRDIIRAFGIVYELSNIGCAAFHAEGA